MKSLLAAATVLAGVISANAVTFTPNPSDLGDLDSGATIFLMSLGLLALGTFASRKAIVAAPCATISRS
jgi:hypothetical protein